MTKQEQTAMTIYTLKRKERVIMHTPDPKNKTLVLNHYKFFGISTRA
jgi:hypothetical protein